MEILSFIVGIAFFILMLIFLMPKKVETELIRVDVMALDKLMNPVPPELVASGGMQDFVIVNSIKQITDAASLHGLISTNEEAIQYWELFKSLVKERHLLNKASTYEEVRSASQSELSPICERAEELIKAGKTEGMALSVAVVEWFKKHKDADAFNQMKKLIPPELAANSGFQEFIIVDTMVQITNLAKLEGLIKSEEEAFKYWHLFKTLVTNNHALNENSTFDEVSKAIERELSPICLRAEDLVKEGYSEQRAVATSVVNWYEYHNL